MTAMALKEKNKEKLDEFAAMEEEIYYLQVINYSIKPQNSYYSLLHRLLTLCNIKPRYFPGMKKLEYSGLLRQPQLITVQGLVKCLYSALITNYCQLHDREYH